MIWIKNHGVTGRSDELRRPLADEVDEVSCHKEKPEQCPAIVVMRGWTALKIDSDVSDVRDGFENALGSQLRFAVDESSDHDDYEDKSSELDAFYNGTHPDLNEA